MHSPFHPPAFASYESQLAYEKLKAICSNPSSRELSSDELFSLVRPTYYSAMEFIGVRDEHDLCETLADLHWWEIHGANVRTMTWIAAASLVALAIILFAWRRRKRAASAVGGAVVSGLAYGLRAKRRTSHALGEIGKQVREKADRDNSN